MLVPYENNALSYTTKKKNTEVIQMIMYYANEHYIVLDINTEKDNNPLLLA